MGIKYNDHSAVRKIAYAGIPKTRGGHPGPGDAGYLAQSGGWSQSAIALESQAILMNQPRGPQLEYRVKAINTGGQSPPTNTVAIVL